MLDFLLLMQKSGDLLCLFWLISSALIVCSHIVMHFEPKLNVVQSLIDLAKPFYYFGKLKKIHLKNESASLSRLTQSMSSIPKSWFRHFYVVGVMVHSCVFLLLLLLISQAAEVSGVLQKTFGFLSWYKSEGTGFLDQIQSFLPTIVVFVCEEIQLLRRLYECYFISSFSNGTMSVIHYFYGMAFYSLFGIGILTSLPVVSGLPFSAAPDSFNATYSTLGVIGFLVASYFQHKTLHSFAALRVKERDTTAQGHYIPSGHLFRWVSSPHYLCEILIYLSLCLAVQWKNLYLVCATVFVICNQASASLSVHSWYRQTFKNYPKDRKAVLPYLL